MTKKIFTKLPDKFWETLGSIIGVATSVFIATQIFHEIRSPGPSSLSIYFVFGFLFIYLFWFFYGVHYRRIAIWLTNVMAALLQLTLLIISLIK